MVWCLLEAMVAGPRSAMRRVHPSHLMGFVPSLETLPIFGSAGAKDVSAYLRHQPVACSSYGNITRDLLTGKLASGILPWEIFVGDLLALPGQRDNWSVTLFLHACPTELVFGGGTISHVSQGSSAPCGKSPKVPKRLSIGVESRRSLTQEQVKEWVGLLEGDVKLVFRMLPMELMGKALRSEAVDGIVVPTPWGLQLEEGRIGKLAKGFFQGRFGQDLVLVQARAQAHSKDEAAILARSVEESRKSFTRKEAVSDAAMKMAEVGRPVLSRKLLQNAVELHPSLLGSPNECVPDRARLVGALEKLAAFSALPPSLSAVGDIAKDLVV